MPQVDALKKISLSIRLRGDPPPVGEHPARVDVTFICGIGREGITPFERRLAGRSVGDEIDLRVSAPEMGIFFEHLAPALAAVVGSRDAVHLDVRITGVEPADGREIVKAMAEMASQAEGRCGCGCGCG